MDTWTVGAIALRPTGNQQGGYYFLSLHTGRIINRLQATPLPMPQDVIKRVEQLAEDQEALLELAFGNRDNRLLAMDIEDDEATNDEFHPDKDSRDESLEYEMDVQDDMLQHNNNEQQVQEHDNGMEDIQHDVLENVDEMEELGDMEDDGGADEGMNKDDEMGVKGVEDAGEDEIAGVQGVDDIRNKNNAETNLAKVQPNEQHGLGAGGGNNLDWIMDVQYGPRSGRYNL
ncbi:hypothetical protein ACA910_010293 [Epithemia clementina (nom. ined.)]